MADNLYCVKAVFENLCEKPEDYPGLDFRSLETHHKIYKLLVDKTCLLHNSFIEEATKLHTGYPQGKLVPENFALAGIYDHDLDVEGMSYAVRLDVLSDSVDTDYTRTYNYRISAAAGGVKIGSLNAVFILSNILQWIVANLVTKLIPRSRVDRVNLSYDYSGSGNPESLDSPLASITFTLTAQQ